MALVQGDHLLGQLGNQVAPGLVGGVVSVDRADVPAEAFEERVEEFAADLGFVVVGGAVGFPVAVESFYQIEDLSWWLRHLDGKYLRAGEEIQGFWGGGGRRCRGQNEVSGQMAVRLAGERRQSNALGKQKIESRNWKIPGTRLQLGSFLMASLLKRPVAAGCAGGAAPLKAGVEPYFRHFIRRVTAPSPCAEGKTEFRSLEAAGQNWVQQCSAGAGLAAAPEFTKAGVAVDLGEG